MSPRKPTNQPKKRVESIAHQDAKRKNIPTAEHQSVMREEEKTPIRVAYERRNRDLDPQLVWRGKDEQDWSDLVVSAPPLYIQEKVHPKVIIDDLMRQSQNNQTAVQGELDLFADFNGLPKDARATEFYQHEANWTNRMILGDSLQVMASLAEREGLRGQVQMIYIDPPYGIKFNSNFQWSTTSRDVKDGKVEHITREPEQVRAYRDTWRDGIHSYLTYLRDRLTVARDLLTDSGSIFVQIGDENVHRVRAVMDEVFGDENFIGEIYVAKTSGFGDTLSLANVGDYLIWYSKQKHLCKYRQLYQEKGFDSHFAKEYRQKESLDKAVRKPLTKEELDGSTKLDDQWKRFRPSATTSQGSTQSGAFVFEHRGKKYQAPAGQHWKTSPSGLVRLNFAERLLPRDKSISYIRYFNDFPVVPLNSIWIDMRWGFDASEKRYVVETNPGIVARCILMTTDPGDLVLDPTCGSGTTAYVAEQWGRRWITIDTSRVALALARARIMGARYPYYLLADSPAGRQKEAEITGTTPPDTPTYGNIRLGFVYERVPHITLKSIANNTEIDVIYEKWQPQVLQALADLNAALRGHPIPYTVTTGGREGHQVKFNAPDDATFTMPSGEVVKAYELVEWEVPRQAPDDWSPTAKQHLETFWQARIARQKEIDASIAAKAEFEYLYDKPYEDKTIVRVAGPFTVESLSPHRVLAVDENDELIGLDVKPDRSNEEDNFVKVILENLRVSGVQQAHKENKINFISLVPFPGQYICAEGQFEVDGEHKTTDRNTKRAGIFIGPEFGTVSRADLVAAAREAGDNGFDVLIACAFNYDAHSAELDKLGRIPILKARMNADLHMANDLKNTGKGNLFVIFGEPDILVASEEWLVDSSGAMIAPYEIFKLVSGVSSLVEINRFGSQDLCSYATISCRREIWDYITNAAGSNINPCQHSGGTSPTANWRISTVSWHCARFSSGTRNIADFIRQAKISSQSRFRELVERLHREQKNAKCTSKISIQSPLTTTHYSQITIYGVDVFHPQSGEVRSSNTDEIACWFIDTDYNEESFFVRHAYFLGAGDPYKSLKTTLKAEIDEEAWSTLYSDTSRPFPKPKSGRIAVKVINHLGDEVMKVFSIA